MIVNAPIIGTKYALGVESKKNRQFNFRLFIFAVTLMLMCSITTKSWAGMFDEKNVRMCVENSLKKEGNKLVELKIGRVFDTGEGFLLAHVEYAFYNAKLKVIIDRSFKDFQCWTDGEKLNADIARRNSERTAKEKATAERNKQEVIARAERKRKREEKEAENEARWAAQSAKEEAERKARKAKEIEDAKIKARAEQKANKERRAQLRESRENAIKQGEIRKQKAKLARQNKTMDIVLACIGPKKKLKIKSIKNTGKNYYVKYESEGLFSTSSATIYCKHNLGWD